MLKKILSLLLCMALILSTITLVASADTVILVDGYTDASGNFYAGGDSGSGTNGWTAPGGSVQWNGGSSGSRYVRIYGGSGIQTDVYSFVSGADYKIYASLDGEGGNTSAILSVNGSQVGDAVTVGNPSAFTEFVWEYTATASGAATINIARGSNTLQVNYIRVEQVGEVAPAVASVKAIKGDKSYVVTDGMDNLVGGATALEIAFVSAPSDTAQYNSTNIAVTSGGQTVTTTVAPKAGDDKTAVVTFNMGYTTTYTLTVSGISNGAGTAEAVTYTFTTAGPIESLDNGYLADDGNYYLCTARNTINSGYTQSGCDISKTETVDDVLHCFGRFYGDNITTTAYTLEAGVEYTIVAKVGGEADNSSVTLTVDGNNLGSQTIGKLTSVADFIEVSWKYTPATSGQATMVFTRSNTIYFEYMRVEYTALPDVAEVVAVEGVTTSDGVALTTDAVATDISYDITGLEVAFNQDVDAASAITLTKDGAAVGISVAPDAEDASKAIVTINDDLVPGATYALTIAGITNEAGTSEAATYTFTLRAAQLPAVTSVTAGGAAVAEGGKIPYTTTSLVIAFNTAIAPASVTKTNITLSGVDYEVAEDNGTAVVTFAGLDTLENYTLTVSGVENEYNGAMSAPYTLSFSTTGINKPVAALQGEDANSWTYTAGEYGYDVRENCVTLNGGDTYITSKAVSVTSGTDYVIDVSAAKNSGYQNSTTTSFKVTVSDGTEFTVTLPSEYDVFSTYSFNYSPAATGDVTFTIQRSGGYCNYDIDYVMVSEVGTAKLVTLSATATGSAITAVVKGADAGDDVYLALYAADSTLAKCYKLDYAGEDVVFNPEVEYSSAIVFLWADGTTRPLCAAAPVQ